MNIKLFAAALCMAVSSACSTGVGVAPVTGLSALPLDASRTDPSILSLIATEIPPSDRATIYDALDSLDPDDRGTLTLFDNGMVYGNTEEARASGFYYMPTADPQVFAQPDGTLVRFPNDSGVTDTGEADAPSNVQRSAQAAGEGTGTGIAHSRYSQPGYSYMSAQITAPCSDSVLNGDQYPRQAGYIYSGGRSSSGQAADVGIQFNHPDGTLGHPTSVQKFINAESALGSPVGNTSHIHCDASYRLTSYVTQSATKIYLVGVLQISGGKPEVLMQQVARESQWSKVCPRCQTKRVTSLAVPKNTIQTVTGTWFGLQNPYEEKPTPTVRWHDAVQSYFASKEDKRPVKPKHWYETSSVDLPSNGVSKGLIVLNVTDAADEAVGINESGPRFTFQ